MSMDYNRNKLVQLRDKCAQALYSIDDSKVINRDYLCTIALETAILRADAIFIKREIEDIKRDIKTIKKVLMTR